MTPRSDREAAIEIAAYRLLAERGYAGTSMLAIAKAAKASNETLYRWYGDKAGLIKVLVERNAEAARRRLEAAIDAEAEALTTLTDLAPVLLRMLLGERAIGLNRAAAADMSGELGAAIAASGRNTILPLIEQVIRSGLEAGQLRAPSAGSAAESYLNLLVGDLQVRRVNRSMPEPGDDEIASRCETALLAWKKLCEVNPTR